MKHLTNSLHEAYKCCFLMCAPVCLSVGRLVNLSVWLYTCPSSLALSLHVILFPIQIFPSDAALRQQFNNVELPPYNSMMCLSAS